MSLPKFLYQTSSILKPNASLFRSCYSFQPCFRAFSTSQTFNAGFGLKDGVSSNFQPSGASQGDESRSEPRSFRSRNSNGNFSGRPSFGYKQRRESQFGEGGDVEDGDLSFLGKERKSFQRDAPSSYRRDRNADEGSRSSGLRPRFQTRSRFSAQESEDGDFEGSSGNERRPRPRRLSPPSKQLFVGNIPFESTELEIREFFETYGEMKDIRIGHHEDGQPRGFCHIEFLEQEHAEKVMADHKEEPLTLGKRPLRLDFAAERTRRNW